MTTRKIIDCIREHTPVTDQLIQLAEEAAELSQAALKMVRIIRGVSPTNVLIKDAERHMHEEMADVICCIDVIMQENPVDLDDLVELKLDRWKRRISEE